MWPKAQKNWPRTTTLDWKDFASPLGTIKTCKSPPLNNCIGKKRGRKKGPSLKMINILSDGRGYGVRNQSNESTWSLEVKSDEEIDSDSDYTPL